MALITLLAAGLFFFRIGRTGFWMDEGSSWYFVREWGAMWEALRAREANMWLYYVLLHGWIRMFGESTVAMRSLSALAATACVPVVYVTARLLIDRRAAVAAALLMAFNPYMVRYAQETRSYSCLCLTSAVSTLLFVRIFFQGRTKGWPLYAVTSAAGVWFHFHGVFVPMAHVLFVFIFYRQCRVWKPLWAAWFLFFFLIIPIPFVQPLLNGQLNHLPKPVWRSLPELAMTVQGGGVASACLIGWLGVVALVWLWHRRTRQKEEPAPSGVLPFLAISVAAPVVAVYALSVTVTPLWALRYFTFLLPAYCVMVPAILDRLPFKPVLFGAAVLSMLIAQAALLPVEYRRQNDPWDKVVAYLAERGAPRDGVLLEDLVYRGCYFHAGLSVPNRLPLITRAKQKQINTRWLMAEENRMTALSARYPRLWLVVQMEYRRLPWVDLNRLLDRIGREYDRKSRIDFGGIRVFLFEAKPVRPAAIPPSADAEPRS